MALNTSSNGLCKARYMVVIDYLNGSSNVFYEATMSNLRKRVAFNVGVFERGNCHVERYREDMHVDYVRNSPRGITAFVKTPVGLFATIQVRKADRTMFV